MYIYVFTDGFTRPTLSVHCILKCFDLSGFLGHYLLKLIEYIVVVECIMLNIIASSSSSLYSLLLELQGEVKQACEMYESALTCLTETQHLQAVWIRWSSYCITMGRFTLARLGARLRFQAEPELSHKCEHPAAQIRNSKPALKIFWAEPWAELVWNAPILYLDW